jgi:AcrR family transcriptional regulator
MPRPSSKEALLDAAEAIVTESGAAHLTLDAVAERAGISKGGLIYNFPTKEALLEAMIGRLIERFDQIREKVRGQLPSGTSNELLVEIMTIQSLPGSDDRLSSALLAVTANQPELMNSLRQRNCQRFKDQLTSRSHFERSAILLFAALGLHFHDLLKMSMVSEEQRNQIFTELLRLARLET